MIKISTYDESLSISSKFSESVQITTCTNFLIWCQLTTKTISRNNTDSFKPVCQLWTVILNCIPDSKPQRDVQQHKLL